MNVKCLKFGLAMQFAGVAACDGGLLGDDPVCKMMYRNHCQQECVCPEDFECALAEDGYSSSSGGSFCFKSCDGHTDCLSNHLCTAVTVYLSGGEKAIEGRCTAEAGPAKECPDWSHFQELPSFPDQQEIGVCEWDGVSSVPFPKR